MYKIKMIIFWIGTLVCLLFTYVNCSNVELGIDEEGIQSSLKFDGSVKINKDKEFTKSTEVTLTITASSADEMMISYDPSKETFWEPYSKTKSWTLLNENSGAQVYVLFKSKGVVGKSWVTDDIIHDSIAPVIHLENKPATEYVNSDNFLMNFSMIENGSGIKSNLCSKNINGPFTVCENQKENYMNMDYPHLTDGLQTFYMISHDFAGNFSEKMEVNWKVDRTKPTVSFTETSPPITSATTQTFEVLGRDTGSGVSHYIYSHNNVEKRSDSQIITLTGLTEGLHTIHVWAIDHAGNPSIKISHPWEVHFSAPVLSFLNPRPKAYSNNTQGVVVNFQGRDKDFVMTQFQCKLNNGGFAACSSPHTLSTLSHGVQKFVFRGKDRLGNWSSPSGELSWTVDTQVSPIRFTQLPPAYSKNVDATFKINDIGEAISAAKCNLNNAGWVQCPDKQTLIFRGLSSRNHNLKVQVFDMANNPSNIITHTWTVDTQINNIEFTLVPPDYSKNVNATFRINDIGEEISIAKCSFDSGTWTECPGGKRTYTFPSLSQGVHTLRVRVWDNAGNPSNLTPVQRFTVDTEAPTLAVTGPDGTIRGPASEPIVLRQRLANFTIDANDNLTTKAELTINCKHNGTTVANCNNSVALNSVAGTNTFSVEAIDKAGNKTVNPVIQWTAAVADTSITFVEQPEAEIYEGTPALVKFVVDNGGYEFQAPVCTLNNINVNCANNTQLNLGSITKGSYIFKVSVINDLNITVTKEIAFTVKELESCENGGLVCLVLEDDFERNDFRGGDFGWIARIEDNGGTGHNVIIDIKNNEQNGKVYGEASSGENALFFTGRKGGSVHSLNLVSKAFDLSNYDKISLEFDYLMASFEKYKYGSDEGMEYFHVYICTAGEQTCKNNVRDSSNYWVPLYEKTATLSNPINQHLTGSNHTAADFTNIRGDSAINIDLNDTSIVGNKSRVSLRWTFKIDEGLANEGQVENGKTPDAGILDNVIVKAYKNR